MRVRNERGEAVLLVLMGVMMLGMAGMWLFGHDSYMMHTGGGTHHQVESTKPEKASRSEVAPHPETMKMGPHEDSESPSDIKEQNVHE